MASVLNKRQQARNERTLQDLIKNVPGNSVCADCGARNPGWASWSVGIFLCMRCAALHRKLGTHISKVKSLSMDKWDSAQVDNMKRIGNTESNKSYNPRNVKPQMPIDIDEVDGAMERHIRQKYEQRAFMTDSRPGTRSNTGSSSSVEDRPPPLPPKPTRGLGFGLRKASTQYKSDTPPISPGISNFSGHDSSPPRINKPSRVFGSSVTGDGLESKLATLRDMGFPDEKRNLTVLKGLNGNLDRAVEALIRLGEQNPGKSRGNTPTPPDKLDVNGLMLNKAHTMPATTMTSSTNPFEALDAVAPLPQQQQQQQQMAPVQTHYGGSQTQPTSPTNPFHQFASQQQGNQFPQQTYQQPQNFAQSNPFGQQQQSLEQSFQGMQLSSQQQQQPPQPLFPNRTGSHAQQPNPPFAQSNPFQQSFTPPPMPQMPPQYASFYQPSQSPPPQPQFQPMSSPSSPGNPFLKSTRSQMFSTTSSFNANPFGQIPAQQHQQAPQPPTQYQQQSHIQPQQTGNPFMMQQQNQTQVQQAPNPFQNQQVNYSQFNYAQQAHAQQSSNPFDKNSILALYNQPQLAPQRPEQAQAPPIQMPASAPGVQSAGHMNPFAAMQSQAGAQQPPSALPPQVQQGSRHVSNESVDFAGLMGGRHSPDAFSGLSSSFRR
ncbi:ArfGap-domain-containing protein [Karstenula rhodostoma CBS 690.94]|uniref:ArfGap-domain-containing protein n=1 Tax=Karstenula rhodostoma CBS 690.94 TaxID=1392251 RepID=A0A9P4PDR9_9PLEO|nr:ArfGap-domain-containing protein [Karstenula rhodostoma CBS 690.94]